MKKSVILILFIIILVALGAWIWSSSSNFNLGNDASQSAGDETEMYPPFVQVGPDIDLRASTSILRPGESVQVTWDTSKVPVDAKGVVIRVMRADGKFLSSGQLGAAGLDPFTGEYELIIPEYELSGFDENVDYYIAAWFTEDRDPNSEVIATGKVDVTMTR